jgi:hypothetical protein
LFGSERKWLSAVHEFGKRVRLADLRDSSAQSMAAHHV